MRSLTLKQAQKWLEKVKETNPNAYRDIGKCLRKFDQTSDELECFLKLNQTLYSMPNFAEQINTYMQQGNKFTISMKIDIMLASFLDIVCKTKKELMKQIVEYVTKITKQQLVSDEESMRVFKTGIIEIVKNYPHLVMEVQKINYIRQEDAIKKLDLKHLKNKVIKYEQAEQQPLQQRIQQEQQNEQDQQASKNIVGNRKNKKNVNYHQVLNQHLLQPQKPRERQRSREKSREKQRQRQRERQKTKEQPKQKTYSPISFLTVNEQKSFIKQLEKKLGPLCYNQLIKLLQLYQHNIITRLQLLQLVEPFLGEEIGGFRDLAESREIDRRKNSFFKPLCDTDFHILPRQTHSYIEMPSNYPHFAINRTKQLELVLNNNWVSVPRGSEVIFNVRIKNIHEQFLNKCQDERYEFDLVIKRLRQIIEIFSKVLQRIQERTAIQKEVQRYRLSQNQKEMERQIDRQVQNQRQVSILLKSAYSLGVVQVLYKNATKEQKQVLESSFQVNPVSTIKIVGDRIKKTLQELEQYKNLYATKMWNEVAHKNFHKSLDFKNHEFKNYEKLKMKPQSFLDELNINLQYLETRGTKRINENPFEGKKQFFSVLNSFQTCSRKERCNQRKLPPVKIYNIKQYKFPTLLPAMILSFEDKPAMDLLYNYISYYLEYSTLNENQRARSKLAFKQININFFRMTEYKNRWLSPTFEEEKFFNLLTSSNNSYLNLSDQIIQSSIQTSVDYVAEKPQTNQPNERIPFFNLAKDSESQYSFEPPKSDRNLVFYASENFYVFLRYLYILYERIIRMKQVSKSPKVIKLFEILYFTCIKTKENARFEDCMNILFGDFAYLFTTFYKIVEGIVKTLSSIALSLIENHSFTLLSMKNEEVYLLLLNRYMLNLQVNTNRLIRATFEIDSKLVYINSFNPYYRFNQQNLKQYNKKRLQISKTVENYNSEPVKLKQKSKQKGSFKKCANRQEYYFESYSNRLVNIACFEDVIVSERRNPHDYLKKQLNKLKGIKQKNY